MARTFTAQDLIQLPSLGAEDAIALVTQLGTVAKNEGKLPAPIQEALDELHAANENLKTEVKKRGQADGVDPAAARVADGVLDRAWSSTEAWLSGWATLGGHAQADDAARAHRRLFPDGLTFLTKKYKVEWTESQMRLDTIAEEKLDKLFDALGGKPFFKTLRAAHDAYGEALGITRAKASSGPAPLVRDALDSTLAAAREYVAQVAGSVRRKKPDSEALATRLLSPLASWETTRRAPGAAALSPDPAGPATPAPEADHPSD